MKNIKFTTFFYLLFFLMIGCAPQVDEIGDTGVPPTSGEIIIDDSDPFHPIFKAVSENSFIYAWDLGNNQKASGQIVSAYYPFAGDYKITCVISGAGGEGFYISTTYTVTDNDPKVAQLPVWKELTNGGAGRTWVYNTDVETGKPDYCYQTGGLEELETYPDAWMPSWSWGQCVQITPDIKGEMVFDLNGGVNYTYHHVAGDAGVAGSFILDADNMTLTITNPYILDHNIECTNPAVTSTGVYQIKLLNDEEMVLWQDQADAEGTGWGWSFKVKK